MPGYKNRFIRLDFPELGDDIWVDILNPMTAPASTLSSDVPVETDEQGGVKLSDGRAMDVTYDICAKLIVRWNVYDALDLSDDPQPMELPATIDKVKRLPMPIIRRIMDEMGKATAQMSASTSTKS